MKNLINAGVMDTFPKVEGETVEFKLKWTDEALKDLVAFANTKGGKLYIGINDKGEVVGINISDEQIQKISNIITSRTQLNPSINIVKSGNKNVLVIEVDRVTIPVAYNGRYLKRVGSTNRDFSLQELSHRIIKLSGRSWDNLLSEWTLNEIDKKSIEKFIMLAEDRLPYLQRTNLEHGLKNLKVLEGKKLKNAGVLLFAKQPQRLFPQAKVKLGVFKGTEIIDSKEFEGTLWDQLEKVMERFKQVLTVSFRLESEDFTLQGVRRQEAWAYPLDALREAVINALIHRDYTSPANIQIRIYDDRLTIWNPGELPEGITIEDLKKPGHVSVPRNPLIAQVFYYAGLVEQWGIGTTRIVEACVNAGLPEPIFEEQKSGFMITFLKDIFNEELLIRMGLNDRQIKAVLYMKKHGKITNKQYQLLTGASKATASRDLEGLLKKGVVVKKGKHGRGVYYELNIASQK